MSTSKILPTTTANTTNTITTNRLATNDCNVKVMNINTGIGIGMGTCSNNGIGMGFMGSMGTNEYRTPLPTNTTCTMSAQTSSAASTTTSTSTSTSRIRASHVSEIIAQATEFINSPRAAKHLRPRALIPLQVDELPLTSKAKVLATASNQDIRMQYSMSSLSGASTASSSFSSRGNTPQNDANANNNTKYIIENTDLRLTSNSISNANMEYLRQNRENCNEDTSFLYGQLPRCASDRINTTTNRTSYYPSPMKHHSRPRARTTSSSSTVFSSRTNDGLADFDEDLDNQIDIEWNSSPRSSEQSQCHDHNQSHSQIHCKKINKHVEYTNRNFNFNFNSNSNGHGNEILENNIEERTAYPTLRRHYTEKRISIPEMDVSTDTIRPASFVPENKLIEKKVRQQHSNALHRPASMMITHNELRHMNSVKDLRAKHLRNISPEELSSLHRVPTVPSTPNEKSFSSCSTHQKSRLSDLCLNNHPIEKDTENEDPEQDLVEDVISVNDHDELDFLLKPQTSAPNPQAPKDCGAFEYEFELWKNMKKNKRIYSDAIVFPTNDNSSSFTKSSSLPEHSSQKEDEISVVSALCIQKSSSPKFTRSKAFFNSSKDPFISKHSANKHSSEEEEDETNSRKLPSDRITNEDHKGISWRKGSIIGEGTFGKVFMGLNNVTGELFAVKQIEYFVAKDDEDRKKLWKLKEEISVMRELEHPHIVRYRGTDEKDNNFYIFMEYVPGGSIASMLSKFGIFSEDLMRRYIRQIVEGVRYLHSRGIVHRDIKGANVLVNEHGIAKLADFGCSKQLHAVKTNSLEESLRSIRGSVPWMAPEVIKQCGHDFKADIWSIGATMIEMASAKHPWPALTNNLSVMYTIATSTKPPPIPIGLSALARSFIDRCLQINPLERADANELLQHPFLMEDKKT